MNGKRVDYFKGELSFICYIIFGSANVIGKTAVRVLTGPAYLKTKKVPSITDEKSAEELLTKLLPK